MMTVKKSETAYSCEHGHKRLQPLPGAYFRYYFFWLCNLQNQKTLKMRWQDNLSFYTANWELKHLYQILWQNKIKMKHKRSKYLEQIKNSVYYIDVPHTKSVVSARFHRTCTSLVPTFFLCHLSSFLWNNLRHHQRKSKELTRVSMETAGTDEAMCPLRLHQL